MIWIYFDVQFWILTTLICDYCKRNIPESVARARFAYYKYPLVHRKNATSTGRPNGRFDTIRLLWSRSQSTTCHSTYSESLKWPTRLTTGHGPSGSSSSPTGPSRACPSRPKGSLTLSVRCTRRKSSLAKKARSPSIAGNAQVRRTRVLPKLFTSSHRERGDTC